MRALVHGKNLFYELVVDDDDNRMYAKMCDMETIL